MKHRIAALTVAVICLISMFSIPCFAAETQPPATQAPTVQATIVPGSTIPATVMPTETGIGGSAEMPTNNSPMRGTVTETPTEIETTAGESTEAPDVEEPEAPDTGKAFVIGLACILLGGIIAGFIIYKKRKNEDGSDEE